MNTRNILSAIVLIVGGYIVWKMYKKEPIFGFNSNTFQENADPLSNNATNISTAQIGSNFVINEASE